jgi:hypothetical protein
MSDQILQCLDKAGQNARNGKSTINKEAIANQRALRDFYNLDADKKLFDKFVSIEKIRNDLIIEGAGKLQNPLINASIEQVGYLIGEIGNVSAGANFIIIGKKFFKGTMAALNAMEKIWDAFLNPSFIPKAGDVLWDDYHAMKNQIESINEELKNQLSQMRQIKNESERNNMAKEIREIIKYRDTISQCMDNYGKWLESINY